MTALGNGALAGIRVLDFSTLLPGPLATLVLAEAGAEVLRIEPPDGDPLLSFPAPGGWGVAAHRLLNAGKRIRRVDLKDPAAMAALRPEIEAADVLVEQSRPGVMARLGLGPDRVRSWNTGLIYCSITGFGQAGPQAGDAGHDLTYMAEAGLLAGLPPGVPIGDPPRVLAADIAGGALPAALNILMALVERQRTGLGRHLDIAMTAMARCLAFPQLAMLADGGAGEFGSGGLLGGSPRYGLYRTQDGRSLAVGALEPPFWRNFCDAIELPAGDRDDRADPDAVRGRVAARLASHSAAEWLRVFAGRDCCVALVRTPEEAFGLGAGGEGRAFPVPLDAGLRRTSRGDA